MYAYDYDVLGACYPFEGDKVSVHWFRGKVIIVAKENAQAGKGPSVFVFLFEFSLRLISLFLVALLLT